MERDSIVAAADSSTPEVDRLVLKGKGLLDLCLERGSSLSMKGFIDSQVERGDGYRPVVEQMAHYFDIELARAERKDRRALLLDLRDYATLQLHALPAAKQPGDW